jgi:murein DD-endopeptidase MepM/ murein hydrolase activator NlpD
MTSAQWLPLSLPLWRFAAASAGSVLFTALLSVLLRSAARRWPALAAHRSIWLLAQAVVALVFVCACLPLPRTALLAGIALPGFAPPDAVAELPRPAAAAGGPTAIAAADRPADATAPAPAASGSVTSVSATPVSAPALVAVLRWLPAAWLGCYLSGLLWMAGRRYAAARRWQQALLQNSRVLDADELATWPGCTPRQLQDIRAARLRVRTTGMAVSPALLGWRKPCLVLPAHLHTLSFQQQAMVIEHELTHWRRADGAWLALSSLAALLFWFNRPLQRLDGALREAVELGCDDAVLAGRGQRERQTYAAALVAQLRLQGQDHAAPAFGQLGVKERVLRMRELQPARLGARGRCVAGLAAAGLALLGFFMQPALSSPAPTSDVQPADALPADAPRLAQPAAAGPAAAWRYPLAQPRATSLYGVRSPQRRSAHHGIDFAARRGTQVSAVAGGIVIAADTDDRFGNYVRIDHGHGRQSMMAHLDRIAVAAGQHVTAGQAIGAAGATGLATGPHLHLEYWQDGHRRNPELMLADLASHATARALTQRKAQGFPIPDDE